MNVVPKIMAAILKTILGKVIKVKRANNSCIDDILVDENIVSAKEVICHLKCFGLTSKTPKPMEGRAALGLKQWRDKVGVSERE